MLIQNVWDRAIFFTPNFSLPKRRRTETCFIIFVCGAKGRKLGGCQQTQSLLEMPLEKTWHGVRTRMFMEMNAISHCWRRHEQNSSGSLAHPLQAFGKKKSRPRRKVDNNLHNLRAKFLFSLFPDKRPTEITHNALLNFYVPLFVVTEKQQSAEPFMVISGSVIGPFFWDATAPPDPSILWPLIVVVMPGELWFHLGSRYLSRQWSRKTSSLCLEKSMIGGWPPPTGRTGQQWELRQLGFSAPNKAFFVFVKNITELNILVAFS